MIGTAVFGFEGAQMHPKENDAALLSRNVASSKGARMHPWSKFRQTQDLVWNQLKFFAAVQWVFYQMAGSVRCLLADVH